MHNSELYHCRVCGLMQEPQPWGEDGITPTFELCGCCGVTFGYQDCNLEYVKKYRTKWLARENKWLNPKEKPENWSIEEQLKGLPEAFKQGEGYPIVIARQCPATN